METRSASVANAALITAHRKAMFADIGKTPASILDAVSHNFEPWVARMLTDGKYIGWVTENESKPVASAGLFVLDWAPHILDPAGEHRGYLLNVFVEPGFRRRGLARTLVDLCLGEARRRHIRVVSLHSSDAGKALYEGLGFRPTNEMFYIEPDEG